LSDIHDLLKAQTALLHERSQGLAFFEALRAHQLPKVAIVSFLRCLAVIHAILERRLSQISQHQAVRIHHSISPRLPFIMADLKVLDAASLPSVAPAMRAALDYADQILGETDPLILIGTLYVLESSQSGALAFRPQYARCLMIAEDRLSYLGCHGTTTAIPWSAFFAELNALSLDAGQRERMVASAAACIACLGVVCTAVYPHSPGDLKYHAASINVEAGEHAIPQSPIEIDLALRAGKAAWEQFPYLQQRYGVRGRRFTNSDSCWLVTLTYAARPELVTRALDWLRTVLAPRGIPTLILEAHVRAIQAIAPDYPEEVRLLTAFDPFLSDRDAERRKHFGADGKSPLIDAFDRRLQASSGLRVESAAELICSAWIDERSGVRGSRSGLLDWFNDRERFSGDWIANVNEFWAELDRVHS
jgi:heme oxygenase